MVFYPIVGKENLRHIFTLSGFFVCVFLLQIIPFIVVSNDRNDQLNIKHSKRTLTIYLLLYAKKKSELISKHSLLYVNLKTDGRWTV